MVLHCSWEKAQALWKGLLGPLQSVLQLTCPGPVIPGQAWHYYHVSQPSSLCLSCLISLEWPSLSEKPHASRGDHGRRISAFLGRGRGEKLFDK